MLSVDKQFLIVDNGKTKAYRRCSTGNPVKVRQKPERTKSADPSHIQVDHNIQTFKKTGVMVRNYNRVKNGNRNEKNPESQRGNCVSALDIEWDLSSSEYDTDIDDEGERKCLEDFCQRNLYTKTCDTLEIVPCNAFLRQINSSKADISQSHLTVADIKAISIALVNNAHIETLKISGNEIGPKGTSYIAEALRENVFIVRLELSAVNMGVSGVEALVKALNVNRTVTTLDLSKNKLDLNSAADLSSLIQKNDYIVDLDLSGNCLDDDAGKILGPSIAANLTLKRLDLSWNHFRKFGAYIIVRSICKNVELEHVNLSWNGLSDDGCRAFENYLHQNHTLLHLDVSNNRIGFKSLAHFLKGLKDNDTLKELNINDNPITTDGAIAILKTVEASENTQLVDLNIQDIPINRNFCEIADDLKARRGVKIQHRALVTGPIKHIEKERQLDDYNPILVLFEYMRQENFRLIDMFRSLDTDNDHQISKEELRAGFKQMNIKVTDDHIDQVIDRLDKDRNDSIDFFEMKKGRSMASRLREVSKHAGNEELKEMMVSMQKLLKKAREEKMKIKSAKRHIGQDRK